MLKTVKPFFVASLPEIRFGAGKVSEIPAVLARYGRKALLVTGRRSFVDTPHWERLLAELDARGVAWEHTRIEDEPSPALVDQATGRNPFS